MKQILNISNSLSFLRLLLSLPFAFALWYDEHLWMLIIIIIGVASDFFDGFFARKLNQVTEFGKIIDPIADKVFIVVCVTMLIIMGKIPAYLAIATILRDGLILIGGFFLAKKMNSVPPSNMLGKITVNVLALAILGIIFDIKIIVDYASPLAFLMLIASFIVYSTRIINIIKNSN